MNNLQLLQCTNLMDIMSLGDDISEKLKSNTKQTLQIMDEVLNQKNNSIVKSLNKILSKVDIEELSEFDNRKKGIAGLIEKVKNTKKQLEEKYTSILREFDTVEDTVLTWKDDLKRINTILTNSKTINNECISELSILREQCLDDIEKTKQLENNQYNQERINIMNTKINNFDLKIKSLEQMNDEINVVSITNYNTYKNASSVYDTTVPMIQMHISVKSITAHHRIVAENSKYVMDKNNEIVVSIANEIIKSGEEAIAVLGDTSNFAALESARKIIKEGQLMLERKQSDEILKIQNHIEKLKLEGGSVNVNLIN